MLGEVFDGRYRVVARIGEGGYGAVYRAEDQTSGNAVALKVLRADQLDESNSDRFRREAELGRRLRHPNTVQLLDFGVQDGLPFLVFELLEGKSLQALLKDEGPLPWQRVARMARRVLEALIEAHGAGVVHRDIKPANLFVAQHPSDPDCVKVLDFGIAKSLRTNTRVLTQQGDVLGTASYMAPEQIDSRPVSPSIDLYSLGLVMSEMLTGKKVFSGSTIDVALEQISKNPVPIPEAVLATPLGPIIARATEKRLERRYVRAEDMLRDVEALFGLQVPAESHPSLQMPLEGPIPSVAVVPAQNRSVLKLALLGVALCLGLALIVALIVLFRGSRARSASAPIDVPSALEVRH